ncbi:MAG: hypothetical protein H6767_05605 [Candidatus Peribacteria bacterium]|nr:MAG: hypothetical protein H6767_05605 [Candidatus Peribacteria bacterium]
MKKKQAEKFAHDGHPLKVSLMLRGRENCYGDIAQEKVDRFIEGLKEIYKADGAVKRNGNTFVAMLKPIK